MSFDSNPLAPPPTAPAPARARTGLILLVTVVTELVVIAATNNQGVTDYVNRHAGNSDDVLALFARASQSYAWRFDGLPSEYLAAGYLRIGVVVVLTALLMLAVIRGPITFGRAFFGTWMAVVVATLIGALAAGAAYPRFYAGFGSKASDRLFPQFFGSGVLWGGLGLGVFLALVAAIVAVATRRQPAAPRAGTAPVGDYRPPTISSDGPPPRDWPAFQPPPPEPPYWAPLTPTGADAQATAALPRWHEAGEVHEGPPLPQPGVADAHTVALPPLDLAKPTEGSAGPVEGADAPPVQPTDQTVRVEGWTPQRPAESGPVEGVDDTRAARKIRIEEELS